MWGGKGGYKARNGGMRGYGGRDRTEGVGPEIYGAGEDEQRRMMKILKKRNEKRIERGSASLLENPWEEEKRTEKKRKKGDSKKTGKEEAGEESETEEEGEWI